MRFHQTRYSLRIYSHTVNILYGLRHNLFAWSYSFIYMKSSSISYITDFKIFLSQSIIDNLHLI